MKILKVFKGYPIYLATDSTHKYYAIVDGKKINFGHRDYDQYKDKVGYYSSQDHGDPKRRENFKKRHEARRHDVGSATWFSDQLLW